VLELGDDLARVHSQLDHFQSHAPPQWLGLLGLKDSAKAAPPNFVQSVYGPIRRPTPAALSVSTAAIPGCRGRSNWERSEKSPAPSSRGQQALHSGAEPGFSSARRLYE
jgi:hypothetical protein